MNLYQVFNGYMENGPVFVIVLAEDEKTAQVLAAGKFKESRPNMGERYWSNLEVNLLSDCNTQFVSEVEEG